MQERKFEAANFRINMAGNVGPGLCRRGEEEKLAVTVCVLFIYSRWREARHQRAK